MKVFNDLKTRGCNDILIAVIDGLKGMPEALGTVYPATTLQTCIVHLIRNSLDYASWKDRKALAAAARRTQLLSFCLGMPRTRAVTDASCPALTSRTASNLNSSVYRAGCWS